MIHCNFLAVFFQLQNRHTDLKGSLSSVLLSQKVAQANQEVMSATHIRMRQHSPYQQYTVKERVEIDKCACNHDASNAACVGLLKLGVCRNETTARSIKQTYVEGCGQKRRTEDDGEVAAPPPRKCCRPLLLGRGLD